jgi:hypothetical protein
MQKLVAVTRVGGTVSFCFRCWLGWALSDVTTGTGTAAGAGGWLGLHEKCAEAKKRVPLLKFETTNRQCSRFRPAAPDKTPVRSISCFVTTVGAVLAVSVPSPHAVLTFGGPCIVCCASFIVHPLLCAFCCVTPFCTWNAGPVSPFSRSLSQPLLALTSSFNSESADARSADSSSRLGSNCRAQAVSTDV